MSPINTTKAGSTLLVLATLVCAASAGSTCCPDFCRPPDLGKCPVADESFGLFDTGSACLAACPEQGSCEKSSNNYVCSLAPCGPDPCSLDGEPDYAKLITADIVASQPEVVDELLGSKPVGYCLPGTNKTSWPLRVFPQPEEVKDFAGSYAYTVALAHLMKDTQQTLVAGVTNTIGLQDFGVNPSSNSVYVPQHKLNKFWTLSKYADTFMDLEIDLGTGSYPHAYAGSDDVVVVGHYSIGYGTLHFTAYDATAVNTTLSDFTGVPTYMSGSIPFRPVVHKSTVFVLQPAEQANHHYYSLYTWDARDLSTVKVTNLTVSACTDSLSSRVTKMWARPTGDVVYFTAVDTIDPAGTFMCKHDLISGESAPLLPPTAATSHSAVVTFFFDNAVAYSAYSGTHVNAGGTVVCLDLDSSPQCTWLQQEFDTNVPYQFTSVYSGYQRPVTMDHTNAIVVYKDAVVYQSSPGVDLPTLFAFNITSQEVQPVSLPYAVPNTWCNHYTSANSDDIEEFAFSQVFVMANGSLVMIREYPSNINSGQEAYDIVRADTVALRNDLFGCPTGCSVHGGLCVAGECRCVPGCTGPSCSQETVPVSANNTFCNPAVKSDDDF